jgi:hypothetical protein
VSDKNCPECGCDRIYTAHIPNKYHKKGCDNCGNIWSYNKNDEIDRLTKELATLKEAVSKKSEEQESKTYACPVCMLYDCEIDTLKEELDNQGVYSHELDDMRKRIERMEEATRWRSDGLPEMGTFNRWSDVVPMWIEDSGGDKCMDYGVYCYTREKWMFEATTEEIDKSGYKLVAWLDIKPPPDAEAGEK